MLRVDPTHWFDQSDFSQIAPTGGTWTVDSPGRLMVRLMGTDQRVYDRPSVIVFELRGDALIAIDYDQSQFGTSGMQLWRVVGNK